MQTECNAGQLEFVDGRRVMAAFDGGAVTSDAGALLLRETDRAIRLIARVAACFSDGCDPGQRMDALPTLLRQRIARQRLGVGRGIGARVGEVERAPTTPLLASVFLCLFVAQQARHP